MKKLTIFLWASLLISALVSPALALRAPEKLVYDVAWTGIKAGTAVQEVTAQGDDLRIFYTLRSAGWMGPIFSVDDKMESVIPRSSGTVRLGTPKFYREDIKEGKTRTKKEARFDLSRLKVNTKDLLKNTDKTDPISARTFDSLSSIYFIRSSKLVIGKTIHIDIYDCKRLWNTEVQVVRSEEISTPLGKFKTIVVKTLLKSGGVVSRAGNVTVWITDDDRRIPVRITTKLKVGEVTMTLAGGSYRP